MSEKTAEIILEEFEATVTYTFTEGEKPFFNCREGYGSPGYSPEIEISKIEMFGYDVSEYFDEENELIEELVFEEMRKESIEAQNDYSNFDY